LQTAGAQLAVRVKDFLGDAVKDMAGEDAIAKMRNATKLMTALASEAAEKFTADANAAMKVAIEKAKDSADAFDKMTQEQKLEVITKAVNDIMNTVADNAQKVGDGVKKAMKEGAGQCESSVSKAINDAMTISNILMEKASATAQDIGKKDIDFGSAMAKIADTFDGASDKAKNMIDGVGKLITKEPETTTTTTTTIAPEKEKTSSGSEATTADGATEGTTKSTSTGYDSAKDPTHKFEHIRITITR